MYSVFWIFLPRTLALAKPSKKKSKKDLIEKIDKWLLLVINVMGNIIIRNDAEWSQNNVSGYFPEISSNKICKLFKKVKQIGNFGCRPLS